MLFTDRLKNESFQFHKLVKYSTNPCILINIITLVWNTEIVEAGVPIKLLLGKPVIFGWESSVRHDQSSKFKFRSLTLRLL